LEAVTAYLGLGSNIGWRSTNLTRAVCLLGKTSLLVQISSIYETLPWGIADQPKFLNCVLKIETNLAAPYLLDSMKTLETEMGREEGIRYGPRLIDIDLLIFGDRIIDLPHLQIPHPQLCQRAFVLIPLAELAPELKHPTLKVTIAQLAALANGKEGVKLWGPPPSLSGFAN
jgi:2-amino-4-hydroxy-6-hydroxymethyldihydropteridine diphosphokinase